MGRELSHGILRAEAYRQLSTACEAYRGESVGGLWGHASASVRGDRSGSCRSAVKSMVAVRRAQLEQFVVF